MNPQVPDILPPPPESAENAADRRRWRTYFWLFFLATPVMTLMTRIASGFVAGWLGNSGSPIGGPVYLQTLNSFGHLIVMTSGCLGAGWCLMKSRMDSSLIRVGVFQVAAHAAVVLLAYCGLMMLLGAIGSIMQLLFA